MRQRRSCDAAFRLASRCAGVRPQTSPRNHFADFSPSVSIRLLCPAIVSVLTGVRTNRQKERRCPTLRAGVRIRQRVHDLTLAVEIVKEAGGLNVSLFHIGVTEGETLALGGAAPNGACCASRRARELLADYMNLSQRKTP
jgi:hypothetical protein